MRFILWAGTTTADELAALIAAELVSLDATLTASAVGNQVVLRGAAASTVDPLFVVTSQNAGDVASQLLPNGSVPIFYNRNMTSTQVRDAIRTSLANGMGEIDTNDRCVTRDRCRLSRLRHQSYSHHGKVSVPEQLSARRQYRVAR